MKDCANGIHAKHAKELRTKNYLSRTLIKFFQENRCYVSLMKGGAIFGRAICWGKHSEHKGKIMRLCEHSGMHDISVYMNMTYKQWAWYMAMSPWQSHK